MAQSFLKNVIFLTSSSYATIILSLVYSIFLARFLGPEGRGVYAIVVTFGTLATYFTSFGLGQAIIFYTRRNVITLPESLGFGLLAVTFSTFIATLILFVSYYFLHQSYLAGIDQVLLCYCLIFVAIQHCYGLSSMILIAVNKFSTYGNMAILRSVIALVAILILGHQSEITIEEAVGIDIVAFLLPALFMVYLLSAITGYEVRFPIHKNLLQLVCYGLKNFTSTSVAYLHFRADIFMVNYFLDPKAVGLYALGVGISEKLGVLPSAIATALFPIVSDSNDSDYRRQVTAKVLRVSNLIALTTGVALALLAGWLIPILFSNEFYEAVSPFRWLLVAAVLYSAVTILESYFKGIGQPFYPSHAHFYGLIVNITSNIILIPYFNIIGAAYASILSYGFVMFLLLIKFKRESDISYFDLLFIRKCELQILLEQILGRFKSRLQK